MDSQEFKLFLEHDDPHHPDVPWSTLIGARTCFIDTLLNLWMDEGRCAMLSHYIETHTISKDALEALRRQCVRKPNLLGAVETVAKKGQPHMSNGGLVLPILEGFVYLSIEREDETQGIEAMFAHPTLRQIIEEERHDLYIDITDSDYLVEIFRKSMEAGCAHDRNEKYIKTLQLLPSHLQKVVVEALVQNYTSVWDVDQVFMQPCCGDQIQQWAIDSVANDPHTFQRHQINNSQIYQIIDARKQKERLCSRCVLVFV